MSWKTESVKILTNADKVRVTKLQSAKTLLDRLHAFVLMDYWVIQTQKDVTIQVIVLQTMTVQKVQFVTKPNVRTLVKTIKYVAVMRFARFSVMIFNANVH